MHHNMLYFRKSLFDIVMHFFGHIMCILKRDGSVQSYFNINVDFISKNSSSKYVNLMNIWIAHYAVAKLSLHFFVTGVVNHFVDCIFENIGSSLYDKYKNH